MKINNIVFSKNEVLKMVMTRAWFLIKSPTVKFLKITTLSQALKRAWSEIKKNLEEEVQEEINSKLYKTIKYTDYKNNPAYKYLKTVANSYNKKTKEITVMLNSYKVDCICGHPGGCYGDCIINQ